MVTVKNGRGEDDWWGGGGGEAWGRKVGDGGRKIWHGGGEGGIDSEKGMKISSGQDLSSFFFCEGTGRHSVLHRSDNGNVLEHRCSVTDWVPVCCARVVTWVAMQTTAGALCTAALCSTSLAVARLDKLVDVPGVVCKFKSQLVQIPQRLVPCHLLCQNDSACSSRGKLCVRCFNSVKLVPVPHASVSVHVIVPWLLASTSNTPPSHCTRGETKTS